MLIRVYDLADVDPDNSILTDDERERAARFRFEEDRNRFTAARSLLRNLLASQLCMDAREIRIETGPYGKPFVEGLEFNVSHSWDRVVIAIAQEPVGVDVERIDPRRDTAVLASRYFSSAERAWIDAQQDPVAAFFRMWTMKEAVMKADGRGMSLAVEAIVVDPLQKRAVAEGTVWDLAGLDAGEGYAACVAAAPPLRLQDS